ncbi:transportin-3-like [Chironomus tepperi]|uniref:transportin-3-like n=1 Tax=Chironomus tepperi TaxID=113505 RepID=UPI00391F561A
MTVLLMDMKASPNEYFIQKIIELELLLVWNSRIEKLKVLTQIFVSLADKVFQWASEHPNEIERRTEVKDRILTILIKCAAFKACCELELPFLKKLPTYLKSSKIYVQYIEELILCFALHCQIIDTNEMETNLNSSLMVFRESISEVMLTLTSIINTQSLIDFFFSMMPSGSANDVEVCLYIIASVARKIDKNEDSIVPKIIDHVLKIDISTHASILSMAAKLLKEFDGWIAFFHQQYLLKSITFLVDIINKKTIAAAPAATAFGQICSTCSIKMEPYLDELILMYQSLYICFIHSKAKLAVIKGITHIGCSLSEPKRTEFLKLLCDIQLARIFESQPTGSYFVHQLDCLAEIFHSMHVRAGHNEVNPLDKILVHYWPHIYYLLDAYHTNPEVVTKISEAIECGIPNISLSALPLLDQLAKHFMLYFGISKCPLLLRPLNAIVDKLGNEEKCKHGLLTVFEGVTVLVMNALHVEMKPKLVDEYFYLAAAYFKKLAMNMLKSPIIIQVIELSIELCKVSDKSSNGYVLDFLICIFTCNQTHPDIKLCVEQAMTLFGDRIIRTLMESAIYVFDITLIGKVVNIFDAFKTKSNAGFKELLIAGIAMMPNRSATGTVKVQDSDVKKFVDLMTREKLPKCEMISGISEFRKLMRG